MITFVLIRDINMYERKNIEFVLMKVELCQIF